MVVKMNVCLKFLFFTIIFSTSHIIAKRVKNVEGKINISNNNKKQIFKPLNVTTTKITPKLSGKWQVGRVSRKQYEIINMLWKKTKIFVETEEKQPTTTSDKYLKATNKRIRDKIGKHMTLVDHNPIQESFQIAHPKSIFYSSTPSYIEFYYLDELDDRIRNRDTNIKHKKNLVTKYKITDKTSKAGSRSPLFLFRVNDATCKATTLNYFTNNYMKSSPTVGKVSKKRNVNRPKNLKTLPVSRGKDQNYEKYWTTRNAFKSNTKYGNTSSLTSNKYKRKTSYFDINNFTSSKRTRANDRIRFFDIYDNDMNTHYSTAEKEAEKMINSNEIRIDEKIYLHHVDHGVKRDDMNNTRYVKKHVNQNNEAYKAYTENSDDPTTTNNNFLHPTATTSSQSPLFLWSDYPFVAVYIYEPTQVRCDSASISPHWLVASATCLNRHHRDIKPEGRSAFVAYCGSNWRHPERIAYVKQSLLHPRFHPRDNSRRQLYNIGAIQVVNSMADTCSGWAPVSLMSHQFVTASGGTPATALGWGLDRYDSRHPLSLPKRLTANEGLVYSVSCPEITGYSTQTRLDEESFRNLYCLSLAPNSEENVSLHGSLLLIGGKLIALYIQEERRNWSDQFIQFTGVWRLIPWLLEVAREPEQFDTFNFEM